MIENTISEIEARIGGAESVSAERRAELLKLLGTLKAEVAALSQTHGEQADSIAGFAQLSAHEATRTEQNPQLRELSLQGLRSSVEDTVAELRSMYATLAHRGDADAYREEARWSRRWMKERFDPEALVARRDGIIARGSSQQ